MIPGTGADTPSHAMIDTHLHVVRPHLPGYLLARRLDDLAYGAGLWWGAWRHRTLEPLRPARTGAPAARKQSVRVSPNG